MGIGLKIGKLQQFAAHRKFLKIGKNHINLFLYKKNLGEKSEFLTTPSGNKRLEYEKQRPHPPQVQTQDFVTLIWTLNSGRE